MRIGDGRFFLYPRKMVWHHPVPIATTRNGRWHQVQ